MINKAKTDLIPTRKTLLSRLRRWDDQESWDDFFNTYWKLLYGAAARAGLSDAEAQDVVQETIISVAKKLPQFKYDPCLGSFKGWLLLIVRRRITDQLRKRYREPKMEQKSRRTERTATVERVADPRGQDIAVIWDEEWQKNILDAAIQRVRQKVEVKQFQIFDCYVLKQWPVKDVVKTLGVTSGQVYLAKHRVGALVKMEIKAMER